MRALDLATLDDLPQPLRGRAVLLRVDWNVPLDAGAVGDDTRIKESLRTLRELLHAGARVAVAAHLGRPGGRVRPELSLRAVARHAAQLLGQDLAFAGAAVGLPRATAFAALRDGEALLLENLRFDPGEETNDPAFAAELARGCEVYVNDAFGCAHRAHASVAGVVAHFQERAAGRLLVAEVQALGRLLAEPERPFVWVFGGAKIEGKIETLESLVQRVDCLLLGGGMANTFLRSEGVAVGRSLVEPDALPVARRISAAARERGTAITLPTDVVVTDDLGNPARRTATVAVSGIPDWGMAVDLGPRTLAAYADQVSSARTVFWNGPLGVFETPPFDSGSRRMARAIAACPGFTVIGGGETLAAAAEVSAGFSHVSTGGGAALELLAGRELPGVAALRRRG